MSDAKPVSSLQDLTNRAVSANALIFAGDHEAWRNDNETRIADLNDQFADRESNYAKIAAPIDNTVRGKLWADTSNSSRVVLKLDPDGSGCDDEIATRLEAGGISFATGGTATHKLMGPINVDTTQSATSMSYTVPGNTLDVNGKIIRFSVWGTKSGTADNAGVILKFGGDDISTKVLADNDITDWYISGIIARTGSATQDVYRYVVDNIDATVLTGSPLPATLLVDSGTMAITLSADASLTMTLTTGGGDTMTIEGMIVELLN